MGSLSWNFMLSLFRAKSTFKIYLIINIRQAFHTDKQPNIDLGPWLTSGGKSTLAGDTLENRIAQDLRESTFCIGLNILHLFE